MRKVMALGLLVVGLVSVGCGENSPVNQGAPSSVTIIERDIKIKETLREIRFYVTDRAGNPLPNIGVYEIPATHLAGKTDVGGQIVFRVRQDRTYHFGLKRHETQQVIDYVEPTGLLGVLRHITFD